MDGYAVHAADLGAAPVRLRVAARIPAGTAGEALARGTAARIFTGAPVPVGADAVVIQEVCTREGDWVEVPPGVPAGANIRRAGEDIAAGSEVIPAGARLGPQHLGLAALPVRRRPRVAILSSGDELVMPGEPLAPGQIYNSNRFALRGLVQALGCEVVDLGVIPDELEATVAALSAAATNADLIVASGGVSVGEEDHIKPAVERLGTLDLWRISMRPGKPLAFGHLGPRRTPFIGTPGNPVSMFVTFVLFARPFLLRLAGVTGPVQPQPVPGRADFDWPKPDRRREFHRARLHTGPDGEALVSVYPSRSSAVLSSMAWANGLVVIPEGQAIARGDPVQFIPMSELVT
jgi:molybdopterin molybdotransferase